MILDGKATAATIRAELREDIARSLSQAGRAPHLAVVLVGEAPASQVYVRNKEKACADVGIESVTYRKSADISQQELEAFIASLSAQENIVHTSDSLENAEIELKRFFVESDYCDYTSPLDPFKYAPDEY